MVQTKENSAPNMASEAGEGALQTPAPTPLEESATSANLVAIEANKTTLMSKIDFLALECGLIRQDFDMIQGCLGSADLHFGCGGYYLLAYPYPD